MGTIVSFQRLPGAPIPSGPPIVTFYGGPGTGKSTTAAQTFAQLKLAGFNAELITEYAKDLVWEERFHALGSQPYVTAKQLWRLDRLRDQVEVAVTDTSTILSLIYGKDLTPAFINYLLDDYSRRKTIDIFLRRDPDRAYNPKGRYQTEAEAVALDTQINELLHEHQIPHYVVHMKKDGSHLEEIMEYVGNSLWLTTR